MHTLNPSISSPIGIFDSGVGGLTVVQSLRRYLPNETLCYFGDTARVPYGTKSAETVKRYSMEISRFLQSHNVKMIVVACNTASSCALDQIRSVFSGPVIGVVQPGARAALQATKTGRIGLIGTRSTVRSGTYQRYLYQENPQLLVIAQPCPLFVSLVEEGWEEDEITRDIARRYLANLVKENLDVVILGCTHYPLMAPIIQSVMGHEVQLVNSAEEVAKEVKTTLTDLQLLSIKKTCKDLFYASDDIENFKSLYRRIFQEENASFTEVPADFFAIVQEINKFRDRKIFSDSIQWFDPL